MTDKVLALLRNESKTLAAQNPSDFYNDCSSQYRSCKEFFFTNALIARCRRDILPFFKASDHDLEHAKKVALNAGTLVLVEGRGWDIQAVKRSSLLAIMAGLLHDICRDEPGHADKGTERALRFLQGYPLSGEEKNMIAFAVRNHERFHPEIKRENHTYQIVGNALHDADKFTWGPDTFVAVLRENRTPTPTSPQEMLAHFHEGIERIHPFTAIFRTSTGRYYGPQFIRQGFILGNHLCRRLQEWCPLPDPKTPDSLKRTVPDNPLSPDMI